MQTASKGTRTVDELLERAETIRQQQLDKLAKRVPQLWEQVFALIGEKRANAYDQAVDHLVDLRDLAQRDGWEAEFQGRIDQIYETYPTLRGLHQRMKKTRDFLQINLTGGPGSFSRSRICAETRMAVRSRLCILSAVTSKIR
ncbi:MAG: hypothetical protein JXJ17_15180 [Anaerolineae bacterium]|nr:hypothetical protein [Anaerolineae bacterium]